MSATGSEGEDSEEEFCDSQDLSQLGPPPVGQNKIQELIQDNRKLRKSMRELANDFEMKFEEMGAFYGSLKAASQKMNDAYKKSQETNQDQTKKIAFLQAEKIRLRREIMTISQQGATINEPQDTNGNGKEDEDYKAEYNDTVSMLSQQLSKAEEEKLKLQQAFQSDKAYLETQWNKREKQIAEWGAEFQRTCKQQLEDEKVEHSIQVERLQRELENQMHNNKQTFMMLSGDIDDSKHKLKNAESLMSHYKSALQSAEERVFQISKDSKASEEQRKNIMDELIRLKQSLEETQRHRDEKEESLDQLFKVYNEERENKVQVETKVNQLQEELDRVLAQYLCAEESLKRKNEEITALKDRIRETDAGTQISVYKQQADIYKKDFEMEREARQKSHQECESMKNIVVQYQMEMQRMKQELMKYQRQQYPPTPPRPGGGYGQ